MDGSDRYEIFEHCLRQVQSGRSIDEVLAPYGDRAVELRPLLETAIIAGILRPGRDVPISAENRSRARFLTAAGQVKQPAGGLRGWLPRFSPALLARVVLIAVLLTGLAGTGFTSAKSIPGDTLYPVKIAVEKARLSFAPNPESRIALEQSFDEERVEESHQVLQLGRSETVSFAGFLEREDDNEWEVGKIHLVMTPEQTRQAAGLEGLYVDVEGQVNGKYMVLKNLSVRLFEFVDTIDRVENASLTVGGVNVRLDAYTRLDLQPTAGRTVRVSAVQQRGGSLIALLVAPAEAPGGTVTYQPGLLPVTTGTPPAGQDSTVETVEASQHEMELEDSTLTPSPTATMQPTVSPDTSQIEPAPQDDHSEDSEHHEDAPKSDDHESESHDD